MKTYYSIVFALLLSACTRGNKHKPPTVAAVMVADFLTLHPSSSNSQLAELEDMNLFTKACENFVREGSLSKMPLQFKNIFYRPNADSANQKVPYAFFEYSPYHNRANQDSIIIRLQAFFRVDSSYLKSLKKGSLYLVDYNFEALLTMNEFDEFNVPRSLAYSDKCYIRKLFRGKHLINDAFLGLTSGRLIKAVAVDSLGRLLKE